MMIDSAQAAAMVLRRHGLERVHVRSTERGNGLFAVFFERARVRHCWLIKYGADADAFDFIVGRQFSSRAPPPLPPHPRD